MVFLVVFLESRRYIVVKGTWVNNPTEGAKSLMFYAPDQSAVPNFEAKVEQLLDQKNPACYNVTVVKAFDSEHEANSYAKNKRVTSQVNYKTLAKFGMKSNGQEPLAYITLSDDECDGEQLENRHFENIAQMPTATGPNKDMSQAITQMHSLAISEGQADAQINSVATAMATSLNPNTCNSTGIAIKMENLQIEYQMVQTALKKAQNRLGVEIVPDSDSSDDELDVGNCSTLLDPNVSPDYYQYDPFFAPKYAYITDASGTRYYMDEKIKIKLDAVNQLKRMNDGSSTSKSHHDYVFLDFLLRNVFHRRELIEYGKSENISGLDRVKSKFVRSIFTARISDDKKRQMHYRLAVIKTGKDLLKSSK